MISIKNRRFLIRNLSKENAHELIKAHKHGLLYSNCVSPTLLSSLIQIGAAIDHNKANEPAQLSEKPRYKLVIPSRIVKPICGALAPLSTTPGLLMLLFLSILGVTTGICRPQYPTNITAWLLETSYLDIFLSSLSFLGCILFHELGHGSACLNRTGLVGCITGRFYIGIPVITTDVSSLHYTSNRNKAVIAISGVVFQTAISVALLILPSEIVRTGATLSLMSAAFALTPLPGSDGYWFLSDLFQMKIAGFFGPQGRKDWVGITYTFFLLLVATYFAYKLTIVGLMQIDHFINLPPHETRSLLSIPAGTYALIVVIFFIKRIIEFLKNGYHQAN